MSATRCAGCGRPLPGSNSFCSEECRVAYSRLEVAFENGNPAEFNRYAGTYMRKRWLRPRKVRR